MTSASTHSLLDSAKGYIEDSGHRKCQLKPYIARALRDRPREPNLRHAWDDESKAEGRGRQSGSTPGQLRRRIPRAEFVSVTAAPSKDEMFCNENSDERGRPVGNQGNEVLEIRVELGGSPDADGYYDGGDDDREDVAWHVDELRHQDLEVECYGVQSRRIIPY